MKNTSHKIIIGIISWGFFCGSLLLGLASCNNGTSNTTTAAGSLQINMQESNLTIGKSESGTVTLLNSKNITGINVSISASESLVVTLSPANCILSTSHPSCTFEVSAISNAQKGILISASSLGYSTVSTPIIKILQSLFVSNILGLVYQNQIILSGTQPTAVDGTPINMLVSDKSGNLFMSTYAGNVWRYSAIHTWSQLGNGPLSPGWPVLALAVNAQGIPYASTPGFVWQYSAASNSWSSLGGEIFESIGGATGLGFDSNNNLYAAIGIGSVWKYANNNWSQLGAQVVDNSGLSSLAISSDNNTIYVGSYGNYPAGGLVYKYNNVIWESMPGNASGGALDSGSVSVLLAPAANIIYAGTGIGNVWGNNGSGWLKLSGSGTDGSLDGSQISALSSNSNGDLLAATFAGNVWQYHLGSWLLLGNKNVDNKGLLSLTLSGGSVFAGGLYSGILWEYLASTNWIQASGPNANQSLDGSNAGCLAIDEKNNSIVGTDLGHVFKYTAQGWILLQGSGESASLDSTAVEALAYRKTHKTIYAGTGFGNVWAYISNAWQKINGSGPSGTIDGSSILDVITDRSDNLYVSTFGNQHAGTVWQYANGAWVKIPGNGINGSLDSFPVAALAVNEIGTLYAGTTYGNVWEYVESAWIQIAGANTPNPIGSSNITTMTYAATNILYIGNKDGEVWADIKGNWQQLQGGFWGGSLDGSIISDLAVDEHGELYASTYAGNIWAYQNGVWRNQYGVGASGLGYGIGSLVFSQ